MTNEIPKKNEIYKSSLDITNRFSIFMEIVDNVYIDTMNMSIEHVDFKKGVFLRQVSIKTVIPRVIGIEKEVVRFF